MITSIEFPTSKLLASIAVCITLALFVQQLPAAEPLRAGWVEHAILYPNKITLRAKLDTGAKTSSINAHDAEYVTHDGRDWVRFSITNRSIETVIIEAPVVRHVRIKRHFGVYQRRPVIQLDLCIGNVHKTAEVNLVDRTGMNYQLLIGRNFLKDAFLIDSGATYRLSPDCPD